MKHLPYSVKKHVHERHPDFIVSAGSWPIFLYEKPEAYDQSHLDRRLFMLALLVKVRSVSAFLFTHS